MLEVTRVTARVRYLPIYTCTRCGALQQATTAGGEYDCGSIDEFVEQLRAQRLRAHDMPVGWASYAWGFACSGCKS
jgi:hypothetical protein